MSISGIASPGFFQPHNSNGAQSALRQQFQKLGQDLKSGNLSQAQSDFAALEQNLPGAQSPTAASTTANTTATTSNTNPITQAIGQLAQDLQSGNLSAAQSDFATLQQDVQQTATQAHPHHHRRHAGGSQNSQSDPGINQSFASLGQALQTGNLQAAQQSYTSLKQELSQIAGLTAITSANTGTISPSAAQGTVNLTA